MTAARTELDLTIHHVTPKRWPDLEALFSQKGTPRACWCMAWRADATEARTMDTPARKEALKLRVVGRREPVGLLAYAHGDPVGWCSVSPRTTYHRLGGHDYDGVPESKVWSLVCFYVHRSVRRQGVLPRLLDAAIERARDRGAHVLEAYPVDPDSPSYQYMGRVPTFEAAGFVEQGMAGTRRHVMALDLR